MERGSGVLLHISSLCGDYMIGQIDNNAYKFVDFLRESGAKYWQILPLAPTSYGDSPYQSCSSFSLSEYFISLDQLQNEGLLTDSEAMDQKVRGERVDYSFLYNNHYKALRKAFGRFNKNNADYIEFSSQLEVVSYAEFRAVKSYFCEQPLCDWDSEYKNYNSAVVKKFLKANQNEINFWSFCQYTVQKQWLALKKYANDNGIYIIGDMPIYISGDSVEVWKNPNYFILDESLRPTMGAGVPPDCFTEFGQLWGNPVYNYNEMKKDNYEWWIHRIDNALKFCDVLRIDHFRGFSRYYAIKSRYKDAKIGKWYNAPGKQIFKLAKSRFTQNNIIGEDLGFIDEKARDFFNFAGYPGMKILQFAFDGNPQNEHLPTNSTENFVMYTGTHDNETLMTRVRSMLAGNREQFERSLRRVINEMGIAMDLDFNDADQVADLIIDICFASPCNACIVPIQDLLHLGADARMNLPATVSTDNWSYRIKKEDLSSELKKKLKHLNITYNR